ncbi:14937_t:CDS:2 [Gigaspora rosea]|nr:14937_t:CDS:2 [Gigaspora rosea]
MQRTLLLPSLATTITGYYYRLLLQATITGYYYRLLLQTITSYYYKLLLLQARLSQTNIIN